MTNKINLNVELRAWLKVRQNELLDNTPENVHLVEFNIHEAKDDIIRTFYDYQLVRGWPAVAKNTADIVGYDESAIRKTIRHKR